MDLVQLPSRAERLGGTTFFGGHRGGGSGREIGGFAGGGHGASLRRTVGPGAVRVRFFVLQHLRVRWKELDGRHTETAGSEGTLEKAENILGSLFDEELIDLLALQFESDQQARIGE